MRAGFARVHADEHSRGTMLALEVAAYGTPGGVKCAVIERRSTGNTANAVGSEKFFGHEREMFLPRVAAAEGLQQRPAFLRTTSKV